MIRNDEPQVYLSFYTKNKHKVRTRHYKEPLLSLKKKSQQIQNQLQGNIMKFNAGKPWILTNLGLNFTSATPSPCKLQKAFRTLIYLQVNSNNETIYLKLKLKKKMQHIYLM